LISIVAPLALLALAAMGCARSEPPRFTASADVAALTANADTEDDKKLMKGLQEHITKFLSTECGTAERPKALLGSGLSNERLVEGVAIFERRCQPCHGTNGDGAGPVAQYLKPLPRDYTKGVFKFVSTPLGTRPRRSDLARTIRRGVTGTSMPAFADMSPVELDAIVDYVIYLSQRGQLEHELAAVAEQEQEITPEAENTVLAGVVDAWQLAQLPTAMPMTPMPPFTPESIAKGEALFKSQACNKCHGLDGRGGSFGGLEVGKDAWGHTAAAADLTSGMFHGGGRPIDIYRRIYVGINGTPMPSFSNAFVNEPDNIWYLVHYIRDMGERRRRNTSPLKVTNPAPGSEATPSARADSPPTGPPAPIQDPATPEESRAE
jgi:mono/diheme cytochrome c family protein